MFLENQAQLTCELKIKDRTLWMILLMTTIAWIRVLTGKKVCCQIRQDHPESLLALNLKEAAARLNTMEQHRLGNVVALYKVRVW